MTDADRIDRIAVLERLQASLEAVKAVEMVAFARSQTAEQLAIGVHPRTVGRGIADQIALACRVSPAEGSRRLHVARDLVLDMPHTLALLSRGDLSRLDRPARSPNRSPTSTDTGATLIKWTSSAPVAGSAG